MSDAKRFFDAIARRYDRVYALSGAASRERLARVLRAIEGKRRVLVLGVGTGRELPALFDAGHEPTGLDVSPEMLAACAKRSRKPELRSADFWQPLPFAEHAFDAAIALHGTLAHPPSREAFGALAKELARVLAPDGVFVAEVPAGEALATIAHEGEDVRVVATGPTTFRHEDRVANVAIEGIALDAAGWRAAFAPALDVTTEPLGAAEHLLVGRPSAR